MSDNDNTTATPPAWLSHLAALAIQSARIGGPLGGQWQALALSLDELLRAETAHLSADVPSTDGPPSPVLEAVERDAAAMALALGAKPDRASAMARWTRDRTEKALAAALPPIPPPPPLRVVPPDLELRVRVAGDLGDADYHVRIPVPGPGLYDVRAYFLGDAGAAPEPGEPLRGEALLISTEVDGGRRASTADGIVIAEASRVAGDRLRELLEKDDDEDDEPELVGTLYPEAGPDNIPPPTEERPASKPKVETVFRRRSEDRKGKG